MTETAIRVPLEPTNPGQFFACCGLLELADRLWAGAEGWFENERAFCIRPVRTSPESQNVAGFFRNIIESPISNSMTEWERKRREELSARLKARSEDHEALEAEKKRLDAIYRESPVRLEEPFHLTVRWFQDVRSGGKELKTWAGQQSVLDIASDMRGAIDWEIVAEQWLSQWVGGNAIPFNFDSDLGSAGSDLDLGFSIDPLRSSGLTIRTRPLIEFAAFVGLERFRPRTSGKGTYVYSMWSVPLLPEAAAAVVCGSTECLRTRQFEFRLLYRTKYLKSFLPATALSTKGANA